MQKRLFNRIDDLLEVKVPGAALAHVADLLTEVLACSMQRINNYSLNINNIC